MNLSLLLGVFPAFAEATAGKPGSADEVDAASTIAIDGVDAGAVTGAFRSLVDQLMLMSGGQPADDEAPVADASVSSEADDFEATLEVTDDADEPESEDVLPTQQPQMWLVELEIINRAAGVPTDLPRRTAVPLNSDQSQDAPEKSAEANDKLGTMPGLAPLTLPEAAPAPTVPAAPRVEITSDVLPQPTAAGAPVDLVERGDEQPTRFAARSTDIAADRPNAETSEPTHRGANVNRNIAKNVETSADSKLSQRMSPALVAGAPVKDASIAQAVQDVTQSRDERVPGSAFPVPRSGSGFNVQRSGVTAPEAATQTAEPRTLNQNVERGTGNEERVQSFIARQSVPVEVAPEPVKAERSTRKADAPSGQPAIDVRAGVVAAANNAQQSGDAPDRSREPEPHLTFSRPISADVQTLGTLAMTSAAHDLLSARMAPVPQPAIIVASVPTNGGALPEETANQIVQAIRFQLVRGGGEATIRLEPKHFGELSITVRVDQGQVTARVQAESPVVREYLQSHQGLLRESLADQQLTLGKFEIAEPPAESRDSERRSAEERASHGDRQSQRRRQPSPNTPFEPFEVVA